MFPQILLGINNADLRSVCDFRNYFGHCCVIPDLSQKFSNKDIITTESTEDTENEEKMFLFFSLCPLCSLWL